MIIRLPFFAADAAAAALQTPDSGIYAEGQVAAQLLIAAQPAFALVCLEPAQLSFHAALGFSPPPVPGAAIGTAQSLSAACSKDMLLLWMASHAAFRGWQSQLGEGGHVANEVVGIPGDIAESCGLDGLLDALAQADFGDGDILVIADKCVSFAFGRIFPRHFLGGQDPKFLRPEQRRDYARELSQRLGYLLSERQLLCIDFVGSDRASVSINNHNEVCAAVAAAVQQRFGKCVDVVISDSDTGVDYGYPLIGGATVGASPLGATAGLSPYEAMRVSVAAEIQRGHGKRIPVVVCRTNARNARRAKAGSARPYADTFDMSREPLIHHGLTNTYFWKAIGNDFSGI